MHLRVACMLSFVAVSACGGGSVRVPDGASSAADKEILGQGPDFAFAVDVRRIRSDKVYAPLLRELVQKEDLEKYLGAIDVVDIVGTLDGKTYQESSIVLAARGAMGAAPQEWRKELDKNDNGHVLPTGVWELASIDKHGWPFGIYASTHDWVLLTGRAAGHGHDYFSSHTSAPPAVDFGDDALVGFWTGPSAMKSEAMQEAAKEPGTRGLQTASMILRDGAHGDVVYTGTYDTDAHAAEAIRVTKDRVGMYASVWKSAVDKCPGLSVLGLESDRTGRTLHMRITHLPDALRAALSCK